jgi:CheY-like chemotaxis protein
MKQDGNELLAGKRVLIVEDEAIIAMLLEDMLDDLGCKVVAVASDLSAAMKSIGSSEFDLAILDVNLRGQPSFPAARALMDRAVRFVFSTGYGGLGIPHEYDAVPKLQKPFQQSELERAIRNALSSAR